MTTIPDSDSIEMRPVMKRLVRRHAGFTMFPPSDREKHDAILVIEAGESAFPFTGDGPDPLLVEAQRIIDEASV